MIQGQDGGEYVCDNSEVMLSERVVGSGSYIYVRNSAGREEANLSKRDANKRKRKQKVQEGKM